MAREQRGEHGDRAEREHRRGERPARGRADGGIAQAPEPEQGQQRERGLGQRDREPEPGDEGAEENAANAQYAFRSTSTRTTVIAMILRSSHTDQRSMYSMSYWMRFSSEVLPRSPCTCAHPVMPDLTLWRSM